MAVPFSLMAVLTNLEVNIRESLLAVDEVLINVRKCTSGSRNVDFDTASLTTEASRCDVSQPVSGSLDSLLVRHITMVFRMK